MKKGFLTVMSALLLMGFACGCASTTDTATDNSATQQTTETAAEEQTGEEVLELDADKKAILVVSFGTSYNDSREKTIEAIENKMAEAFPDYEQRRAFTSQTIINKLAERDGLEIDNVEQAMERLISDGIGTVVVQPTHVMNGIEYEEMCEAIAPYEDKFADLKIGTPLLTSNEDYENVINGITAEIPELTQEDTAVVFMGHGTEHYSNATYAALDYRFKALGFDNVFVGTVESYPDFDKVLQDVNESGLKKVVLYPFMIVAGDHANNDMAGDEEDSWKTMFKKEGYEVECVIKGLGEFECVQDLFVEHAKAAVEGEAEE